MDAKKSTESSVLFQCVIVVYRIIPIFYDKRFLTNNLSFEIPGLFTFPSFIA